MICNVYSIRDNKTAFMQPMLDINDKAAIRNFKLAVANSPTGASMAVYPEDFDLYRIGTFDNETGVVSPTTVPELIYSGGNLEV